MVKALDLRSNGYIIPSVLIITMKNVIYFIFVSYSLTQNIIKKYIYTIFKNDINNDYLVVVSSTKKRLNTHVIVRTQEKNSLLKKKQAHIQLFIYKHICYCSSSS